VPPYLQSAVTSSDGFFRKGYGNRNRKQLVPAVVSFAKYGTETETTYGPVRSVRLPEVHILRRQPQKKFEIS